MSTNQIRQTFLDYFTKQHGHALVSSASLVPQDDPTLLFTNAGMVQFKDVFLGEEIRKYSRAASAQRCVRAGGKHNDLENVGYTKRHHTFFEMLGNFSFGDYFKKTAITFAWVFLTQELKIPAEKLWVTVYKDDQESEDIWFNDIGIDQKRFSRCGEKDNFWSMGATGPCGPCTEIFYDHGPSVKGGPPGSPDEEGDRYTEIWNLVFMQFNRDAKGKLSPLPKPCVDTGMGIERIAAVLQGVHDNYDIDLFQALLKDLSLRVGCDDFSSVPMRVIVDHIRSAAFLIADGVVPSNEGRGYVVRRIIRRAARYGFKLGQMEPFFYQLVDALVKEMGMAYPHLTKQKDMIKDVIAQEEKQFSSTLAKGLKILDKWVDETDHNVIDGHLMFQLYDTYGFPPDLAHDIAKERGLICDDAGFKEAMAKQRLQSQKTAQFNMDQTKQIHMTGSTTFTGYATLTDEGKVTGLLHDFKPIGTLNKGENGIVLLDRTPFYAESGGQVGDEGYLYFESGSFRVKNTQKKGALYLHHGQVIEGQLSLGELTRAEVDHSRHAIKLNHSATHLLHEALRRVLGDHVTQKGSLVEAKRLRFDFSHLQALTDEQLVSIERLVNRQIRANIPLETQELSLEEAKKSGAIALFSEKYADEVRVVSMGNFSKEICGGTHVSSTGEIGLFKIVSESACAAGVRRIEGLTGDEALRYIQDADHALNKLTDALKVGRHELTDKFMQLQDQQKQLSRELSVFKQKFAGAKIEGLIDQVKQLKDASVLVAQLDEVDNASLREVVDKMKQRYDHAVILLASVSDNKISIVASVSKPLLPLLKAPELLNHLAKQVGGKGGGRPDMAQGGGDQPDRLPEAMKTVLPWLEGRLL